MRRRFTILMAAFALLAFLAIPMGMMGQTTVSYGWETSDDATPWTITDAITATSGQGNTGDYAGMINTNHTYVQFNEKVYVTSFSFAFKRTSNNNNYNVYIETSTDGTTWTSVETYAMSSFNNGSYLTKSHTFDGSVQYYVRFHCYNTTAVRYVDDVTITYSDSGASLEDSDLSLSPTALEFDLYDDYDAKTITITTSSEGEITVSDNEYVTTVVSGNTITVTPGENTTQELQTITVSQASDGVYASGTATFTVDIADSTPFTGGDVTFDATKDKGTSPLVKNGVTFVCDNGVLNNGSEYRLYKNSTTTFSVSEGTITQIAFTCTSSNPASGFATQTGWTTDGDNGTWTGSAQEVSFLASGAQVRATLIVVTVDLNATPDPVITADNVNIEYNAEFGSIAYTVDNAVTGGTMSAAVTEGDWLTLGSGTTSPISFTCTANEGAAERTATVTLTYTYNRATATANVVVTQAGNPSIIDNISDITAIDTDYAVRGTVVAANAVGFVIGDGTGYVYTYMGTIPEVAVGDIKRISGTMGSHNNVFQFTSTANIEPASNSNYNNTPAIQVLDADGIGTYSEGLHLSDYVQIEGMLSISGNYYNITVDGLTNTASISYPTDAQKEELNALANKRIIVKGYFAGVSGGHFNVLLGTIEEVLVPSINIPNATVNVPAEGAEGTIEVIYNNFTELAATIYFCHENGEAATYDWIEAEVNDDDNIAYTVSANNGEARTAYLKVFSGDVYSNLVTINQEAYVAPTYAELPFSFNGGRNDIEGTDGLYQEGLGTDYSETTAPTTKLKFDNAGDWLLLQFTERPGALTFNIKGNGFSGGTFTVQTSEDGLTYTNLATYTEITNTQNEEFSNLGENVRFIKWIYTERVNGNVGLGNIVLQDYVEPEEYVLNIGNPEHITITAGYGTDGVLVNGQSQEILSGTEITLALNIEEGYVLETLTIIDENGNIITPTATQTENVWTFNMPNSDVTVNATAAIAPVVTTSTYTLATSIESGKSYIIVGWKDGNPYAMGDQTTNNRAAYGITVDGSTATVASDAGVYEFVIAGNDTDGYTIYDDVTPGYLYAASTSSNWLRTQEENDANGIWTITFDAQDGFANVVATGDNTRKVMQFNNNNTLFSCYASASQHPVYLYVKEETPTVTTQTVALSAGTNWFSTNVEITLEDLEAAIVAAMGNASGTTIKAKDGKSSTYTTRWRGTLTSLDVAQMYKIKAAEACTITLEGEPIIPADHPVTIQANSTNWIGIPLANNITVTDAFAGFAQSGDQIKAKDGKSTSFNGTRWRGTLTNLEPGQGYVYTSGYSEDRQLVFPASK